MLNFPSLNGDVNSWSRLIVQSLKEGFAQLDLQEIGQVLSVNPDTPRLKPIRYYYDNAGTIEYRIKYTDGSVQVLGTPVASSGDVFGPASSADNAIARFDGSTGKLLQNSSVTIDDSGNLTANNFIGSGLTASRAIVTNGSKQLLSSAATATELGYLSGVTSAVQTQLDGKQPLDATLTSLAAFNTSGLLTQTATNTFTGRTLAAGSASITISDGDGVSGNPTIDTVQNIQTSASPTFAGLTLSGLTAGSVLFAGSGGIVSQDNSNLFWDDTNYRLGIGTSTPGNYSLNIVRAAEAGVAEKIASFSISDNSTAKFEIDNASSTDAAAVLRFNATGSGTSAAFTFQSNIETDSGTGPATIFNSRVTGGSALSTRPTFDFRNNNTSQVIITGAGNLGVNTGTTVSAKAHIISTTEQLRLGYDTSNYISATVSSAGVLSFTTTSATAQAYTFDKDVSGRRFITTASTTASPGLQIIGTRANALYSTTGATGGIAFSLLTATVTNTDPTAATWASIGVFGAANEGGGTPTSNYMFIDPSTSGSHSGAAIKVTPGGLFGLGIGSTTAPAARLHLDGNLSASNWGSSGIGIRQAAITYTNTSSSGTVASQHINAFAQPTIAASNTATFTSAATWYIADAPGPGTNVTLTNPYSIFVDAGNCRFDGLNSFGIGNVPLAIVDIGGAQSQAAWTTAGIRLRLRSATFTDTSSSGTVAAVTIDGNSTGTIAASNSVTYTNAANYQILGAPNAGTNVTFTAAWALHVSGGDTRFAANVGIGNNTSGVQPRANLHISGDRTSAEALSVAGVRILAGSRTYTDGVSTGVVSSMALDGHAGGTIAATNAGVTFTNAATVYIANAPTAGTNVTLTNRWAQWIDSGDARFDGNIDFSPSDSSNFVFGTTTGTKHGTSASQKQSFWNATPIVQPTTAVAAAIFVANTSGIANDTATFDGYTIGQVVKALRNTGLLA